MARDPALGSFPKRIRRHEEEIRRLRLRDQRGQLPSIRFWIDGDTGDYTFGSSFSFTGTLGGTNYQNGYHRADMSLSSGDADLAHWDSAGVSGGIETGAIVIDQAGEYLVVTNVMLDLFSLSPAPSAIWAEALIEVNGGDDVICNALIEHAITTWQPFAERLAFGSLIGTKVLAAGDTVSIIAKLAAPEDRVHWYYNPGDGTDVHGFNTYLELIQIG